MLYNKYEQFCKLRAIVALVTQNITLGKGMINICQTR